MMIKEKLMEAAREAKKNAYAPYSKFHVGAAILGERGEVFTGCNVENASFGLTICAERNAAAHMVASCGGRPEAIAVASDEDFCSPCGACRQFLAEFNPKMKIFLEKDGEIQEFSLSELLPHSFSYSCENSR